jgi:glycosyltransferase involved in cell wall biosynthesis
LPRTILESYAVGVPVIGADSGGIPDLIGPDNRDWLFPPGDADALAAAMNRVITQGRDALPQRTSFDHIVNETQPAKVARRYLDLYDEVRRANSQRRTSQVHIPIATAAE